MKWLAGSGLTKVDLNQVILLAQKGPDANAQTATVTWTLPQGIWWKVTGLFANLDATNATAATVLQARYADTAFGDVVINADDNIIPLLFDGPVSLALGLPKVTGATQPTIMAPLPDIIIPPGSRVTLTAFAGAGFNVITSAFMTAEGYEVAR